MNTQKMNGKEKKTIKINKITIKMKWKAFERSIIIVLTINDKDTRRQ